jgi:hypothetical protein
MPPFPPSWDKLLPQTSRLGLGLLVAGLLSLLQISRAESLIETCAIPSYPGKSTAIDGQCGLQGSGGQEAEQNALKNNFCASGPPTSLRYLFV